MGLFRKKQGDILDITLLKKRGIIKKSEIAPLSSSINPKTGFLDLTALPSNTKPPAPSASAPPSQDLFGFLDASASQEMSSQIASTPPENSLEVQSLRVKIEDLEYKLERLLEKISAIESKF